MYRLISNTTLETEEIGKQIGQSLGLGDVVCLTGELGVGKTAFVKGLAKGLGIEEQITSPTFTIVNEYNGKFTLYHFDVYRVHDIDELFEIGFDEYIFGDGITVIEWAELISPILPEQKLCIEIRRNEEKDENFREIILKPNGNKYKQLIKQLKLT